MSSRYDDINNNYYSSDHHHNNYYYHDNDYGSTNFGADNIFTVTKPNATSYKCPSYLCTDAIAHVGSNSTSDGGSNRTGKLS